MSQFQGVKCDECGRIQGEANHWIQLLAWEIDAGNTVAIGLLPDRLILNDVLPPIESSPRDLCGQGCAMKHIAKLLGWNVTSEG